MYSNINNKLEKILKKTTTSKSRKLRIKKSKKQLKFTIAGKIVKPKKIKSQEIFLKK